MAKGKLYRGYVVWTYDAGERVEVLASPDKYEVWQSRTRLEEALQERLSALRSQVTVAKDLEAHIEVIETEILDGP
jgi:hypothetical protein